MEDAIFAEIQQLKQTIKVIGHGLRTLEKNVEAMQEFQERNAAQSRIQETVPVV